MIYEPSPQIRYLLLTDILRIVAPHLIAL